MHSKNERRELLKNFVVDICRSWPSNSTLEVGKNGTWSVSSCKPGYGVSNLRDARLETYWQSDGHLPHLISIQFSRKTTVNEISVYLDYKQDESYTPSRLSIRAGTNSSDSQQIEVVDLKKPSGWVNIPIAGKKGGRLRAFLIQIAVIRNHQNGRDCHIRQILVHSPIEYRGYMPKVVPTNFKTVDFLQYNCIR